MKHEKSHTKHKCEKNMFSVAKGKERPEIEDKILPQVSP